MSEFCEALVYVAVLAVLSAVLGPLIPRSWFSPRRFPFRPFRWEREGKIYEKLGIRRWKDRVPDVSRVSKRLFRKKLPRSSTSVQARRLVEETCVAEAVHGFLLLASLWVIHRWRKLGGFLFWLVYNLLGNVPFILIQRYNRPRILQLEEKLRAKELAA